MDAGYIDLCGNRAYIFEEITDPKRCENIANESLSLSRWEKAKALACLVSIVTYGYFAFFGLQVCADVLSTLSKGWQVGMVLLFPCFCAYIATPLIGMMHGLIHCWRSSIHFEEQMAQALKQKEWLEKEKIVPEISF